VDTPYGFLDIEANVKMLTDEHRNRQTDGHQYIYKMLLLM